MAAMDKVIMELKRLRPEQVDEVQTGCGEAPLHAAVPARMVDEAVRHGWPPELFTELIGSLPELECSAQPPVENRADL